eukprot:6584719-Pyramimonas_sp.AAC.1
MFEDVSWIWRILEDSCGFLKDSCGTPKDSRVPVDSWGMSNGFLKEARKNLAASCCYDVFVVTAANVAIATT